MDGSAGAGSRDEAGVGDLVGAAAAELYGADPQAFTERRGELAAAARDIGDRAAAKAIAALRRPTRAAWVVNRLARADPSAPASLAELGAALRAAQQAGHGPRLRELSAARGALVDALTSRALSLAGVADAPPALRLEVSQTLTAALADPGVAAEFAAGTLTRAVQWSGFGVLPAAGGGDEDAAGGAAEDGATAVSQPRLGVVTGGPSRAGAAKSGAPGGTGAAARPAAGGPGAAGTARGKRAGAAQPSAEAAARRQAQEAERLAREARERAARRREQYEEAERTVASTAAAAADAVAAEDRLEREVRDLEERLTKARADLSRMRMRARQAEAAERRARQALDRLSAE